MTTTPPQFQTTIQGLGGLAAGLNIEGCRPYRHLADGCKWYNLIMAVDEPLKGFTFEKLLAKKEAAGHDLIETAAFDSRDQWNETDETDGKDNALRMDRERFLDQVLTLLHAIQKDHSSFLVHVHQYEGSTALMAILRKNGFRVISDGTNYFENPVQYLKDFREVDGVFSLSQCAGLGVAPGTWILPSAFYSFDVHSNVILTGAQEFVNSLETHPAMAMDFLKRAVRRPILVVDDLWNPSFDVFQNQVLILDQDDSKVLEFVKANTTMFDESHSWVHAVQVAKMATKIHPTKDTLYLALLHDVCDHKYPEALPRDALSEWIACHLPEYVHIDSLIDQVSYSSQVKKEGCKPFPCANPVLAAVRDADRLEALGKVGITRCLTFCRTRLEKDQDPLPSFIHHAYDKLLRLLPDGYITTSRGRATGLRKHSELVAFVDAVLPAYPELLDMYGSPTRTFASL